MAHNDEQIVRIRDEITIPYQQLAEFCQENRLHKLSLYGSALGDNFGPESDIDLLVEFEPGEVVGLFRLVGTELELTALLGRKVDLRLPGELSRYFRQEVLDMARVLYVRS